MIASMLENAEGRVVVRRNGKIVPGVVRGVDEEGRLLVDLDDRNRWFGVVEDRSGLVEF